MASQNCQFSDVARSLVLLFGVSLVLGAAGCRSAGSGGDGKTGPVGSAKSGQPSAPLAVGDPAPSVELTLQDGRKQSLSALRGQHVLVYFYPKDDTAGCTAEAQGIRDEFPKFEDRKIRVFGVSTQDASSHQAFIDKYELPFDLVVDTRGSVVSAFGVPVNSAGLSSRHSFLIAPDGKIARIWRGVVPAQHASEVLAALDE